MGHAFALVYVARMNLRRISSLLDAEGAAGISLIWSPKSSGYCMVTLGGMSIETTLPMGFMPASTVSSRMDAVCMAMDMGASCTTNEEDDSTSEVALPLATVRLTGSDPG